MVVIRLARAGAKKRPFYQVVVADSRRDSAAVSFRRPDLHGKRPAHRRQDLSHSHPSVSGGLAGSIHPPASACVAASAGPLVFLHLGGDPDALHGAGDACPGAGRTRMVGYPADCRRFDHLLHLSVRDGTPGRTDLQPWRQGDRRPVPGTEEHRFSHLAGILLHDPRYLRCGRSVCHLAQPFQFLGIVADEKKCLTSQVSLFNFL